VDLAEQKERAAQFRRFHHEAPMLILPNVWDAASARIVEQAGARAIATTSSGVATALGYSDGQHISRELLVEATRRIARVVACPVTADIEAGYGDTIDEVLQTVRAVIGTGAVGFNIEDSLPHDAGNLKDVAHQVELISALRELAQSMEVPFVINARVDVYLHAIGAPEHRFDETVRRANAYLHAGADCVYPIGRLERDVIGGLVQAIDGPINIMGGPQQPPLADLAQLGVARVSLAGGLMRAMLGHMRTMVRAVLERGDYDGMATESLPGAEFSTLFVQPAQ
jgi:2-methylisocitrate lyase-like PEP mutase family enzyme